MRALLIANPSAGQRRAGAASFSDVWPELRDTLARADFAIEVAETAVPTPTARELAERAVHEGYEAVLVAGGDGTVADAASALLHTNGTLGILPFGSVMNIANSIPVPVDPAEAAAVIARKRVRRIDVGDVADRLFFEVAGVGLDAAAVGIARLAERGNVRGALARLRIALQRESHWISVTADGRRPVRHRALQVLVINARYYFLGIPVVPDADIADGLLDVAVFPRMGQLRLVVHLLAIAIGRRPPERPVVYRGREISIEAPERVRVHADNVLAGTLPQAFRCQHAALAVFA